MVGDAGISRRNHLKKKIEGKGPQAAATDPVNEP